MKVEEVKLFKCPETGKLFESAGAAAKNAEKIRVERMSEAKAKEENSKIADSFRLELDNINNLESLLNSKIEQHIDKKWKVKIDNLRFGEISNSHSCPLIGVQNWDKKADKPKSYLGWSFNLSGNYQNKGKKQLESRTIFHGDWGWSDTYKPSFGGFRGIHSHGGGGGNGGWQYYCRIFLDDFPKLKEKHELYTKEAAELEEYMQELKTETARINSEARGQKYLITWDLNINQLRGQIKELEVQVAKLESEKEAEVQKYIKNTPIWVTTSNNSDIVEKLKAELCL